MQEGPTEITLSLCFLTEPLFNLGRMYVFFFYSAFVSFCLKVTSTTYTSWHIFSDLDLILDVSG